MLSTLIVLVLLGLNGVLSEVHHFQGHSHKLSGAAARAKYELREKYFQEMLEKHHGPLDKKTGLKRTSMRANTAGVGTKELDAYTTATNLSIGTPKQNLVVELDFFWNSDLVVTGTNTHVSGVSSKLPAKHIYNASASNTSEALYNTENHVKDLVKFGSLAETDITFESMNWLWGYFKEEPVDGLLGLGAIKSRLRNGVRMVDQLVDQLDEPLVSLWSNRSADHNGTTQISLGAIDYTKCQKDFSFGQRLEDYGLAMNGTLSAIIDKNGSAVEHKDVTSLNLHFWDHFSGLRVTQNVYSLIFNATQPTVSHSFTSYGAVFVDCNTTIEVTLKVGEDEESLPLTLTAEDVIQYSTSTKKCYLNVENYGRYKRDFISFGQNFEKKHCLHYNIKKDLVAFSTSV